MRRGERVCGYTIVETLIFLIVSASLFVTVTVMFSGRQRAVEFQQSTREFQDRVQNVINEVASGSYVRNDAMECSALGPSGPPTVSIGAVNEKGTNENCVYYGKLLRFDTPPNTIDGMPYRVIGLVARREVTSGSFTRPPENLDEASPVAVTLANTVETLQTRYGLRITRINSGAIEGYGVAFFSTLSGFNTLTLTSNTFAGAQRVSYGMLRSGTLLGNGTDAPSNLDLEGMLINPSEGIRICMETAGGERRASLIIGGANAGSNTRLELDVPCA